MKALFWTIGILLFAATPLCFGQQDTRFVNSLSGVVTDQTGATLPNVAVTIKNVDTGETRTIATDGGGHYQTFGLPLGRIEIRAAKKGFDNETRKGISLAGGQQATVDIKMQRSSPDPCASGREFATSDCALTWHGITAYGAYDVGVGWVSHGLPVNSYNYEGESLVNRNGNHSRFLLAPNNLSQTGLGVRGKEQFVHDWYVVFNASTGINPQGQLANASATQTINNGLPRGSYSEAIDGARAGQPFNDEFYGGVSSASFGTLTFGRQRALGTDAMLAYDPAGGSYAFSYIGYNGTMAGGGDTEDTRWDDAIKYRLTYGSIHFGAMYKFVNGSGGCFSASSTWTAANCTPVLPHNSAYGANFGGESHRFSANFVYQHFNQAISVLNPLLGPRADAGVIFWRDGISVDHQQHQYEPRHRGQCDLNDQHRIRHRDRQHRLYGRRQVYVGPVQDLCRLRIHPADEPVEPVGRWRLGPGRLFHERRRRQQS